MSEPTGAVVVVHRIPAAVTPLGSWLAEIADRVVVLTTAACAPGYTGQVAEVVVLDDYTDTAELDGALDRIAGRRPIARLVSGTEDDVVRVATARERLGVPGTGRATALAFTDKLLMKEAVAGAVARPGYTADPAAAGALVAAVGLPVVVKPRRAWGSRGVHVVRTAAELDNALAGRDPGDVLVEEFVPGEVCHVDGFMAAGEVLVSCPSRYVNDCLAFQDSTPLGSVQLDPTDPGSAELQEAARRVVAALPATTLTPFHLELFRDRDTGALTFCEIAARLGGGHIMESLTQRLGRNPVEIWYRAQAGLPVGEVPAPRPGAAGWLLVPPRAGTLVGIDPAPLPSFVTTFQVNVEPPTTFSGAQASTDSMFDFVVQGACSAEVEARLAECTRLAGTMARWAA